MENKEEITLATGLDAVEKIKSGVSEIRIKLKEVQIKVNDLSRDLLELDSMIDALDESAESLQGAVSETIYANYELTVIWDEGLATQYNLNLSEENLPHGEWKHHPPSQITPDTEMPIHIKALYDGYDTGVQGSFEYTSEDSTDNPSKFKCTFDVPFIGSNSGEMTVTDSLGYYSASGGSVPSSSSKKTVTMKPIITQIGPT